MHPDRFLGRVETETVPHEKAFPDAPRYICTNHRCRHKDWQPGFRGRVGGPPPEPRCAKCGYKMVVVTRPRDRTKETGSGAE